MNIAVTEEVILLTPQAFHILLALAEKPMYGYGILYQCQADAGLDLNFDTGGLYRTLRRLRSTGYIEPTFQLDGRGSPHVRQYLALTLAGRQVLEFECDSYRANSILGHHRLHQIHKRELQPQP